MALTGAYGRTNLSGGADDGDAFIDFDPTQAITFEANVSILQANQPPAAANNDRVPNCRWVRSAIDTYGGGPGAPGPGGAEPHEEDFLSATTWTVTHDLGRRFVDVVVLSPGNSSPTAAQTRIYPEVAFTSVNACTLTFRIATAGTAIVRP
jgi:hypothetical protein